MNMLCSFTVAYHCLPNLCSCNFSSMCFPHAELSHFFGYSNLIWKRSRFLLVLSFSGTRDWHIYLQLVDFSGTCYVQDGPLLVVSYKWSSNPDEWFL